MNSKGYIDAHCHLADSQFDADLEKVLERSEAMGVSRWIQGGICPEDWQKQKRLQKQLKEKVVLSFGIHPWWAASQSESSVVSALKILETELPNARFLGELGLDHAPRFVAKAQWQREVFRLQLNLNQTFKKPLMLHIVQAHSEAVEVLKDFSSPGGIVHAFAEGKEVLRKYLDLGYLISVGGAVTRPGYKKLKEALQFIPLTHLVVETDAPDQTPELPSVSRESRNEPCHLLGIAQAIAELRGAVSQEQLLEQSARNLRELLASSP